MKASKSFCGCALHFICHSYSPRWCLKLGVVYASPSLFLALWY
uniref:Uncharacterized protein n=1 Tax=Anguilla anguilla TaxID=7936 RepID=A0A0E9PN42_ANGAN